MSKYVSIALCAGILCFTNMALAEPANLLGKDRSRQQTAESIVPEEQHYKDNAMQCSDPNMQNSANNPQLYKKPKQNTEATAKVKSNSKLQHRPEEASKSSAVKRSHEAKDKTIDQNTTARSRATLTMLATVLQGSFKVSH
jgi:hypothetical protein